MVNPNGHRSATLLYQLVEDPATPWPLVLASTLMTRLSRAMLSAIANDLFLPLTKSPSLMNPPDQFSSIPSASGRPTRLQKNTCRGLLVLSFRPSCRYSLQTS